MSLCKLEAFKYVVSSAVINVAMGTRNHDNYSTMIFTRRHTIGKCLNKAKIPNSKKYKKYLLKILETGNDLKKLNTAISSFTYDDNPIVCIHGDLHWRISNRNSVKKFQF